MEVETTTPIEETLALKARVKELESLLKIEQLRNAKLDYKLQDLLRRIHGPKNEKLNEAQRQLFGMLDQGEVCVLIAQSRRSTPGAGKKKGGGRYAKPESLCVVREVIDLPEEQKAGLVCIREEITKQLEYKPSQLYMLHLVRPVYASPTRAHAPIVAALPPQVIPQAGVGPGFITHVVVAKYGECRYRHSPYYAASRNIRIVLRTSLNHRLSSISNAA